jgi:Domain of unknown function (DUF4326)
MIKPVRIQRSRQHRQESPNGLPIVYCGRWSKWANPFKDVGDMVYVYAGHRRKILDPWIWYDAGSKTAVELFDRMCMDLNSHEVEQSIYNHFMNIRDRIFDLKDRNLSCWCKLNERCHVDTLIKMANIL